MSDVSTVPLGPDAAGVPGEGICAPTSSETVRYGGFWIRVAACLIDVIILSPLTFVVSFLEQIAPSSIGQFAAFIVSLAITVAYNVLLVARPAQATWGKQVLGLRIVRADGKPIGPGLALGRYVARMVSFLCLCIGVLMVGVTREKRGLHDMMCGTRVVYR